MHKFFYISAWAGILSAILMVLVLGFWMVYPYQVLKFNIAPSAISQDSYKRGTPITYIADYCKYVDVPAEITVQFIDGIVFTLPAHAGSFTDVGCGKKVVQLIIPATLPAGEYKISVTHKYQLNPIRSATIISETNKFFVTE